MMQITIDYPLNSLPRYGYGKPVHKRLYDIINRGRERYKTHLLNALAHKERLAAVSRDRPANPAEPYWNNGFFPALDAVSLFSFITCYRPRTLVEIGSGHSTKFARLAISSAAAKTRLISIDPDPRTEIDGICDHVIRRSFESADLELFSGLEEGDIVLFDGSHRCYMNSDVTVFFLEVLPTLRPGILVHIHDIFLPYDYPPEWADRFYSEQYLLACYLLADNRHFEIELPNTFVAFDAELGAIVNPLWEMPNMQGVQRHGGSFWLSSR